MKQLPSLVEAGHDAIPAVVAVEEIPVPAPFYKESQEGGKRDREGKTAYVLANGAARVSLSQDSCHSKEQHEESSQKSFHRKGLWWMDDSDGKLISLVGKL